MDFAFSQDQLLLKNAARAFLDERCSPAAVRALWDDGRGESEVMWKDMAQLGWLGLGVPEAYGGSGLGMVETAILLEEMGRVACPGPYLPTMLAARAISEAGSAEQRRRWLPAVAAGDAKGSVAFLDTELDWDAPAVTTRAERTGRGWTLTGIKHFVPWAHVADVVVVPARTTEGLAHFLLDSQAAAVGLTPVAGIDPGTRWCSLRLDGVSLPATALLDAPGAPVLEELLRRGAVGAAAEMLGAGRRCLDLAVGYAKVREQLGQPIGAFQAIRHTCAEMLMEVENAHAAVYYAAWALDAGAEDAAVAASVTKAYVSEATRKVCGAAIQVHGGIGFTWEYDLHLYFKRAKALEPMYGDAEYHRELLVRRVAG